MAINILNNNVIYKGNLVMFDQTFSYLFEFLEVSDNAFRFKHKLAVDSLGLVVDEKEGKGTWVKIDENIIKITYSDPETSFEGDLNTNSGEFRGDATQSTGLFTGSKGKFELKYDAPNTM
jgi:hypothetical protein